MNDGTFGCTGEAEAFDQETIDRLENHNFDRVRSLQWRNPDLDFGSLERLRRSLTALPQHDGLTRAQAGPDVHALEAVVRDADVADLATSRKAVELLWSVCQLPDYRNISPAEHAHLVGRVFQFLARPPGYISEDWFSRQLRHCENTEGDLDTCPPHLPRPDLDLHRQSRQLAESPPLLAAARQGDRRETVRRVA